MDVLLRAVSGPGAGVERTAADGTTFTVGRTDRADLPIPQDNFLSGVHFAVGVHNGRAFARDMGSSNGTSVNGNLIKEFWIENGDTIAAGHTTFAVRIGAEGQVIPGPAEVLTQQPGYLFAVLDAARSRKIYPMVLQSGVPYCSLYRGKAEFELEWVAPYLVYLPPDSEMLQTLVAEGWGKSWGIFLTADLPMEEVRKQLRRSLKVNIEGEREQVYFRFYDPRVLRIFLPMAEPAQLMEFGGYISSFLMEDEESDTLLRFYPKGQAMGVEKITVKVPEK